MLNVYRHKYEEGAGGSHAAIITVVKGWFRPLSTGDILQQALQCPVWP